MHWIKKSKRIFRLPDKKPVTRMFFIPEAYIVLKKVVKHQQNLYIIGFRAMKIYTTNEILGNLIVPNSTIKRLAANFMNGFEPVSFKFMIMNLGAFIYFLLFPRPPTKKA